MHTIAVTTKVRDSPLSITFTIPIMNKPEIKLDIIHKNNLKYTFDMELDDSFDEFKKIFIPSSDKNEKEEEKKEEQKIEPKPTLMSTLLAKRGSVAKPKIISLQKKKKKFKCLKAVKKIFYLYLHNFVLTFIILISKYLGRFPALASAMILVPTNTLHALPLPLIPSFL